MMNFTGSTSVKGIQASVETIIGTINVGDQVVISTRFSGTKIATVTEISSRWIKTDFLFIKFNIQNLGDDDMGVHATTKIIEVK